MQTLDLAQISDMLPAKAFRKMSAFGALSDNFVEQVLAGVSYLYHQGERADASLSLSRGT